MRTAPDSAKLRAGLAGQAEWRRFAGEARSLPVAALLVLLVIWCASVWPSPPYSPDSWAYYELSRSIWRGGYRLLEMRGYAYPADSPSGAFPPLWPALWSVVAAASGLGLRAGLAAAFACVVALAGFSEAIARRLSGTKWVGLAAAAGLLATPGFAEEVEAARSIPLQMALASALIWTFIRQGPLGPARAAVMGLLCGALVMTRFDMLAFAVAFGLIVLLSSRSLISAAAFALLFAAAVSPWVTVSWLRFGELFHSDSGFVASAVDPTTFVNDWYPPGRHRVTAGEDPSAWVSKVFGNVPPFLGSAAASPGPAGLALLLVALAALVLRRTAVAGLASAFGAAGPGPRRFAAVAAAVAAPLPLFVVTGYFDARYFSLAYWYLVVGILSLAAWVWLPRGEGRRAEGAARLAALGLLGVAALANLPRALARPAEPAFPQLQSFAGVESCLSRLGARPGDRILFQDDTLAARWAAVHRRPSAMLPRNFTRPGLSLADKARFLEQQGIRFAVGQGEALEPIFGPLLARPERPCGAPVFRLAPGAKASVESGE